MSKILPYIEDTLPGEAVHQDTKENTATPTPTPTANEDSKREITSFTYEQVNDNADELIELRGEGRYFGVTDPSSGKTVNNLQSLGPLCANCHKRGHIRAKCKTVVCHKCGVVGDHYEAQCPTTMICSRCGIKGHMASDCQAKQRKKQYCKTCDTFSHNDYNCPMIWRSYITKKTTNKELPIIFCYNCGSDNHYGDECSRERTSRIPNHGSAFSGSNLPVELRTLYYDKTKKPNHHHNNQNKIPNNYSGGHYNGYNDSRIYDNTDYYERFNNNTNSNNHSNNGYNNGHNRNGNFPSYNNPGNHNNRNYDSRNYQSHSNTNNNAKKPSRSGYIERNVPQRSGYIAKPTKSGLLEHSKKRKQMRY